MGNLDDAMPLTERERHGSEQVHMALNPGTKLKDVCPERGHYSGANVLGVEHKKRAIKAARASFDSQSHTPSLRCGFSRASCKSCTDDKCGVILVASAQSGHKTVIHQRCRVHMPNSDHVKVFDEYRMRPNCGEKSGFIGIIGFTVDGRTLNLKSGTFNFGKVLEWPEFEEKFWRFYGLPEYRLDVSTKPKKRE
jgi:hypothetical protein